MRINPEEDIKTPLLEICFMFFPSVIEQIIFTTAEDGLLFFPENCDVSGLMVGLGVGIEIGLMTTGIIDGVVIAFAGLIGCKEGANNFNSGNAFALKRLFFLSDDSFVDFATDANCPSLYMEKEGRVLVLLMKREIPMRMSPIPSIATALEGVGHFIIAFSI